MKNTVQILLSVCAVALIFSACNKGGGGEMSSSTGWEYNNTEWGGFEKLNYEGQITGPNLVPIEGGTFMMGLTGQDVTFEWDNSPRRVTVSSFYMDETEVSNINYKEYLFWIKNAYKTYPDVHRDALPDTLVWREELAFNEPLVESYLRHPSYDDYPVVGVNWLQAQDFCLWRSNRVNEMLLFNKGIINLNVADQVDREVFDTKAYLNGQYTPSVRKNLEDLATGGERNVRFEDGIMLPNYRLPTEAEWEYAALALQGNQSHSKDELITDRRIYPWNGNTAIYKTRNGQQGQKLANFKRGRGDYMGMAGRLNDAASTPGPVRAYLPNDFGLYNMAGNVSEWTEDVYRRTTSTTLSDPENHDLNPYRGNRFKELMLDEDGRPIEKDSLGRLQTRIVDNDTLGLRENYRVGDVRNYLDGDNEEFIKYGYGEYTLVSDKARVIKGGSWADRLYWLSPGARRFKDEDKSDKMLGFRCAMIRMGSSTTNSDVGGLQFKEKGPAVERRFK